MDAVNRDTAVVHNLLPTGTTKRFDYAYNSVNDILAVRRDNNNSDGDGFRYDLTQQVLEYQENGTVDLTNGTVTNPATDNNMAFDGCGNRTTLNNVNTTFNNMNQPNGRGIAYEQKGNLKTYNGWTYTYDAQNRLTNAVNGTVNASFKYDGKNRQVARTINGVVTFSVWDDWELIEEYTTSNVQTAGYLQGAHGPIKSLLNNVIYFYQDELGSTSHIANSTGGLIESYQYDLYGKPRVYNASGVYQPGATAQVKDLFTGQRWVAEVGLYDLRNRFMSPDLGRFLQPDPIGFKGDASNLYRYVGNDWANRADPTGLTDLGDFLAGVDDFATFGIVEAVAGKASPSYAAGINRNSGWYRAGQIVGAAVGAIDGESEAKGTARAFEAIKNAMARGRESEARVLKEIGEVKNTAKVSGKEGKAIPDFINDKKIGEIKDTKRVTDSPQLRIERDAASAQGKEHEIITGTNTSVSKNAAEGRTITRMDDLGPPGAGVTLSIQPSQIEPPNMDKLPDEPLQNFTQEHDR